MVFIFMEIMCSTETPHSDNHVTRDCNIAFNVQALRTPDSLHAERLHFSSHAQKFVRNIVITKYVRRRRRFVFRKLLQCNILP